jgi:hypothetical protein
MSSCNYCAVTKGSQLIAVKAQREAREALSSLSVCPLMGTLKKPTQVRGGFLECATFLIITTMLL